MIQNGYMDFANADGTPCKPQLTDPGFNDLGVGSAFLNDLNQGAPTHHPNEVYRTIAGTVSGNLAMLSYLLGVKPVPEDGLVPLQSANSSLIGAAESDTVPDDHVEILDDAKNGQPKILQFLTRPVVP